MKMNWEKLKGMDKPTQLKVIAAAAGVALGLPAMALDMVKSPANVPGSKGITLLNGDRQREVTFEQIKGYLAQKYATPSDTPELVDRANQFQQWFHSNMPEMDLGYMQLFDMVDLRNVPHDSFSILDTNFGVTYSQRRPGEATKIRRIVSESETVVKLLEFSAGIGILDRWIDRQMFWNIEEAIAEFRAQHYENKAELFYGLFTALGAGIDIAFDTDDTTTFNKAASDILRKCKGKGYNLGQGAGFYILCAPEKVGRMEKMLTAQRGSAIVDQGTVNEPLAYRVRGIISSTHVTASDTGYYLVLPGRKLKRGEFKDLATETDRNIYTSATDIVGVAQYNGAIGDSDQVRRVKFA